jgi:hypothetical protein
VLKPRSTGETRHPELAMKEPYNRITKAKVTLALVGLLYKQKSAILAGWKGFRKPLETLENEVDRLKFQAKDAVMIQAKTEPYIYWLTLGE